ncbi:MAG: DUF1566 domain-containing protein [Myxococcaceae bacterium]|nr:DUF1566 domain-containing protein [Myxococcaceae bacterium]MBH2005870.1 DUF1566 domain-containing protein [Myxococcaceae bacterium]
MRELRFIGCLLIFCSGVFSQSAPWAVEAYDDETSQYTRYILEPYGNPPNLTDRLTGLAWLYDLRRTVSGQTQAAAASYCATQGSHWRVPTVLELQSLLNYTTDYGFCQIATECDAFKYWPAGGYLASDSYEPTAGCLGVDLSSLPSVSEASVLPSPSCNSSYFLTCVSGETFGPPAQFTDEIADSVANDTTVVLDQRTGLLWMRNPIACVDQYSADVACSFGYSDRDWHLSSIKELMTLIDYSETPPYNETIFNNIDTYGSLYWTSTSYNTSGYYAAVNFSTGLIVPLLNSTGSAGSEACVSARCVTRTGNWPRSADKDSLGQNRYIVGEYNNTVIDKLTQLMWQRDFFGPMSGTAAANTCENVGIGGFTDWRLPNTIEIQSLYDYYAFKMDGSMFNLGSLSSYWASGGAGAGASRYFETIGGNIDDIGNSKMYYVRCVRRGVEVPISSRYSDEHGRPVSENSTEVLDRSTGLVWRHDGYLDYTGSNPASYCTGLAGSWRLPTVKELYSLTETELDLSINTTIFSDVLGCLKKQWLTSTNSPVSASCSNCSYYVGFPLSGVATVDYSMRNISFCIRCIKG